MNRKITRLARAGNIGTRGARGEAGAAVRLPVAAAPRANAASRSIAASWPKPTPQRRSMARREYRGSPIGAGSIDIKKFVGSQQRLAERGPVPDGLRCIRRRFLRGARAAPGRRVVRARRAVGAVGAVDAADARLDGGLRRRRAPAVGRAGLREELSAAFDLTFGGRAPERQAIGRVQAGVVV